MLYVLTQFARRFLNSGSSKGWSIVKINKLWISDYHQFKDQWIIFDPEHDISAIQKEIFGKSDFILFSGENGSGKTTILSFIAYSFRYLQRYRERMPSDFKLYYSTMVKRRKYSIILSMHSGNVFITINDKDYYVQEYNLKKKEYIKNTLISCEQITYENIIPYLPSTVYVIGIDTMYRDLKYSSNYVGDRKVLYRDISDAYKTTNRGSYNSNGILYLYYMLSTNSNLRKLFKSWGLEIAPFVDIKINVDNVEDSAYSNSPERDGYYIKDFFVNPKENSKLYKESGIEGYLSETTDYNKRLRIFEFLKRKSDYNRLKNLIDLGIVYINEYYIRKNGVDIPIGYMSTGEKAFLYDLFSLCANIKENAIIIWEEPETHLNVKWSKNLIPLLVELFKDFDVQWILSSHSSYMIKNFFQSQIVCLKNGEITHPDFNTFMANDVEVSTRMFNDTLNSDFERIVLKYMKKERQEQLELFDILGESYLRFMLFQSMEQ